MEYVNSKIALVSVSTCQLHHSQSYQQEEISVGNHLAF